MSYKPADFFVGIVDTFGVLAPGAILAFAVAPLRKVIFDDAGLFPPISGEPQEWIAFVLFSYIAGYMLWVVASAVLDGLYDRFYSRVRRLPKSQRTIWPWALLWRASRLNNSHIYDPLYRAALEVRRRTFGQLKPDARTGLEDKSAYSWAQSVLALHSQAATDDIERIQASSKFFRSLALTLLVVLLIWPLRGGVPYFPTILRHWPVTVIVTVAVILIGLLYMRLRWDATQRTYEYYLAWYLEPIPSTASSGVNPP